jgi:hypothetical protein
VIAQNIESARAVGARDLDRAFESAGAKQTARSTNKLCVAPAIGLSVSALPASTGVRANTFYGSNQ